MNYKILDTDYSDIGEWDIHPETQLIHLVVNCSGMDEKVLEIDLNPEDFELWGNQWKEILSRVKKGDPVCAKTKAYPKKFKPENFFIDNTHISELMIPRMVSEIKRRSILKRVHGSQDIDEIRNVLAEEVAPVKAKTPQDALGCYFDWYCERREKMKDGYVGIKTGFKWLDKSIVFESGQLVTLGGRPGSGKSAFALNLAVDMAHYGAKVIYLSLEMSEKSILTRAISCASLCSHTSLRMAVDENIQAQISSYLEYTKENLYILSVSSPTVAKIRAIAKKYDVIIIDQLSNIRVPDDNAETKATKVENICYDIHDVAKDLDKLVILCSQLNRGGTIEPKLHHLKNSGGIEEASETVIFLHRPSLEEPETFLICPKNRDGKANHQVKYKFNFDRMRFSSPEKAY